MSRVTPRTNDVLRAALNESVDQLNTFCDLMADLVRELTPYDTGTNKDSITTEPVKIAGGRPVGRVYTQSGYGGWLEIGTARRPATPYFAPAYQRAKDMMR